MTYTGIKPLAFTAGVFKVGFSLESDQSVADILFLERADIVTLTRGIAAGIEREAVQVRAQGDRFHTSLALTAGTSGPGQDGDQRAVVARVAGLPIRSGDAVLHLGLSGEYVFRPARAAGALPAYGYSAQQELRIDQVAAPLNTGSIPARDVGSIGPELGFAKGRLWLQSEWYAVLLEPPAWERRRYRQVQRLVFPSRLHPDRQTARVEPENRRLGCPGADRLQPGCRRVRLDRGRGTLFAAKSQQPWH